MHDVTKSGMDKKNPFRMQDKLISFIVTEYENSIKIVSNSTLQLPFQKLLLV